MAKSKTYFAPFPRQVSIIISNYCTQEDFFAPALPAVFFAVDFVAEDLAMVDFEPEDFSALFFGSAFLTVLFADEVFLAAESALDFFSAAFSELLAAVDFLAEVGADFLEAESEAVFLAVLFAVALFSVLAEAGFLDDAAAVFFAGSLTVAFLAAVFAEAGLLSFFEVLESFAEVFAGGTFAPASRASDKPIATACLRLVTFLPLPVFKVPSFISSIVFCTCLLYTSQSPRD